ncbi:MAG: flagellar biosynthetic protein FliO [Treponema sp.]|nr:flagellar biosynthetic protein FliO [Treponema sp.]
MGGEKLHRLYTIFFAALLTGAGLFSGSLDTLSAQEGPDPAAVPAAGPNPESLITFDAAAEGEEPAAPETLSGFSLLRMALVLALTAAAIYGAVFFFKRLAKPQVQADPYLKVLARASIASGSAVAVVSLGTRAWLVGAGDGGVSLITAIEDQEIVDAMLLDNSRSRGAGSPGGLSFSALLRRLGAGKEGKWLEAGDLRKRRERLNKL